MHFKSSVIAACLLGICWGVVGSEALGLLLLRLSLLNLGSVRNYSRKGAALDLAQLTGAQILR